MLMTGCALSSHPRIADLRYHPGRYQNHTVTLDGVVTTSWGVPLVPVKLYKIDDGTGEVTVVSNDGRAPARGARVRVTGESRTWRAWAGRRSVCTSSNATFTSSTTDHQRADWCG